MALESGATVLRLSRTIQWNEEADVIKNDANFPHFISFNGAHLSKARNWMPYYGETIRLQTRSANIKVSIKNIQFGKLQDKRRIQNQDFLKTVRDFDLKHHNGLEKGSSIVQLSFLPLLYNEVSGEVLPVTSFDIEIQYEADHEMTSSLNKKAFVSSSVLANGEWFKLAVTQTGFYRLDRNFFARHGINISAIDPRTIRIYGNGPGLLPQPNASPRIDDLKENPIIVNGEEDGVFNDGDYVLMYGKSQFDVWKQSGTTLIREKNIYSDTTYYFITFNQGQGKRIIRQSSSPTPVNTQNTHIFCYSHELDLLNIGRTGRQFVGEAFDRTPTQSFNFTIPGFIDTEQIRFRSAVAARTYINEASFDIFANNNFVYRHANISTTGTGYEDPYYHTSGPINTSFQSATPQVSMMYRFSLPPGGSNGWLDFFEVNTVASMTWYASQVLYRVIPPSSPGNTSYTISNVPANTRVFNVTDPTDVSEMLVSDPGNGSAVFVNNTVALTEFAGISNIGLLGEPLMAGRIVNQNLHGLLQADVLFITPPLFGKEAQRLAAFHQSHGFKVHVVSTNDIYNEFSSGAQDITAIRDFIRMFYERWPVAERVKYVNFFGRASYDYKYRTSNNSNFVPTFQSDVSNYPTVSYCSDDYFGFLESHEGLWGSSSDPKEFLDIGIGRLPVSNETEARNAVDKIMNYYQPDRMADWRNRVVFVSDDEDNNAHQRQANNMANNIVNKYKNYNVEKLLSDAYREEVVAGGERNPALQKAITAAVQKGCFILNYTGHGGELGWAAERILTIEDINSWTNIDKLPLFVTATCEFSRFDDPARISAGELAFLSTKGGAIALFTTVRLVSAFSNDKLNDSFYRRVGLDSTSKTNPLPLGLIMALTKNDYPDFDKNERNFTLLGDAVMTLAYPKYNVVTTSINNKPVVNVTDTLKALSKVTITGVVQDMSGAILQNYNGEVFVTVYDKPSTYQTLVNDPGSAPALQFDVQNNIIYSGSASVVSGMFTCNFIVPKDISYQIGRGKISYYATNRVNDGNGYNENFVVGGTADSVLADNTGPEIRLYMNDEKFIDGGMTDEKPLFIAKLYDMNGINTIGRGVGRELSLVIDHDNAKAISVNNYYRAKTDSYQEGEVRYQLSGLAPGKHSAVLQAWDTYNNSNKVQLEFLVASSEKMALQYVLNYPNPFTTNTTFHFDHNRTGENLVVMIQIYTIAGRLAKTLSTEVTPSTAHFDQLTWNGLDEYGDKLANGVYIYKVQVKSATGKTAEATQKLVILN